MALIVFSTSSDVDQLQQDLNISLLNQERLEQKVLAQEREIESLKRRNEGLTIELDSQNQLTLCDKRFDDPSRKLPSEEQGCERKVALLKLQIETLMVEVS